MRQSKTFSAKGAVKPEDLKNLRGEALSTFPSARKKPHHGKCPWCVFLCQRLFQLGSENIGASVGRMPEAGDGKAGCGEGIFTLFPDSEEGKGTGEGEELPGIGKPAASSSSEGVRLVRRFSFLWGWKGKMFQRRKSQGERPASRQAFHTTESVGSLNPFSC